jgi:hypothetical protein
MEKTIVKDAEYFGSFHGAKVDFRKEYVTAREMMGNVNTDLDELFRAVGFLYLNTPEPMVVPFRALLDEISQRQTMQLFRPPTS